MFLQLKEAVRDEHWGANSSLCFNHKTFCVNAFKKQPQIIHVWVFWSSASVWFWFDTGRNEKVKTNIQRVGSAPSAAPLALLTPGSAESSLDDAGCCFSCVLVQVCWAGKLLRDFDTTSAEGGKSPALKKSPKQLHCEQAETYELQNLIADDATLHRYFLRSLPRLHVHTDV